MPLLLAQLPAEVFANIASRLTAKDILETLFGIGNALLTHKLCHGGVVELDLYPSELSGETISAHHLVACQSLSLRTFTLHRGYYPLANKLVLGLKPTLRHLTGFLPDLIVDAFPNESAYLSLLSPTVKAWNVQNTFPELETLNIDFYEQEHLLADPVFAAQFFAGLPSTLTALNVPPFASINFWPLLPPSVTQIFGTTNNCPPSLDVAPNLTSLQSLKMATRPSSTTRNLGGFWTPISNYESTHIPPHLTSLEVKGLTCTLALPSTLTRLKFEHNDSFFEFDLFALMRTLPPSLTRFEMSGALINPVEADLPVLPHLKQFTLNCRLDGDSLHSHVSASILTCLPNLEELKLDMIYSGTHGARRGPEVEHRGIDVEHLSRLNPRTIRLIQAEFKPSCFTASEDGTFPLAPFIELRTLSITPRFTQYSATFSFAAIPSSVTWLNVGQASMSTETLHLLPASVTQLHGSLILRPQDDFRFCLARPPRPHDAESKDVIDFPVETSYDHDETRYSLRRFKTEGSDVTDGIAFEPNTSPYAPIYLIKPLPQPVPSLTSLKLGAHGMAIDWPAFTQSSVPNLRHLSVRALPHRSLFDLGSWTSLRSLEICFLRDSDKHALCPPGLTKLRIEESTLPDSFLPLPTTLTEIECEALARYSDIAHLDNLRSLTYRSVLTDDPECGASLLSSLSSLPRGLTSLALPDYLWTHESVISAISSLLPALETIRLPKIDLSIVAFDRIYHCFPDSVTFDSPTVKIHALPEEVARLCKVRLGSILVPKDERFDFWCYHAMEHAYTRINGTYEVIVHWEPYDLTEGDDDDDEGYEEAEELKAPTGLWSDFAPYLSPDNEELFFGHHMTDLPFDLAKTLPRGLKTLDVRSTLLVLDDVSGLPPTLTKLRVPCLSLHIDDVIALPRSVTSLEVGALLEPSPSGTGAPKWPTGLVDMSFTIEGNEGVLKKLPSSLTKLTTTGLTLNTERLKALPAGLKYYEDRDDQTWDEEMILAALERNLTRLSDFVELRVQSDDPTPVLDQILASFRSGSA